MDSDVLQKKHTHDLLKPDWLQIRSWLDNYHRLTHQEDNSELPGYKSYRLLAETWVFQCWGSKSWDTLSSILLTFLPNLERLKISRTYKSTVIGIRGIISTACLLQINRKITPFALSNLSEVYLGRYQQGAAVIPPYCKNDLMPFLRLPSIKTIVVDGIDDDEATNSMSFASQVQELTLRHCQLFPFQINLMFTHCVALKRLHVDQRTFKADVDISHIEFVLACYFRPLSHLSATLQTLEIIDDEKSIRGEEDAIPSHLISGFSKLHTIDTTADLFLGRWLPPKEGSTSTTDRSDSRFKITNFNKALVHLTLRHTDAYISQYLVFSDPVQFQSQLPNLKTVHVQFRKGFKLDKVAWWHSLASDYRKLGIVLSYNFCYEGDLAPPPLTESNE